MTVRVSKLINDTVEEAESCLIVESVCDLLEKFNGLCILRLVATALVADACGNIQNNGIDHRRLRDYHAIDFLLT